MTEGPRMGMDMKSTKLEEFSTPSAMPSRGRRSHLDAPDHNLYEKTYTSTCIRIKYNEGRLNGCTARAEPRPRP
jgi:hypothetical protein